MKSIPALMNGTLKNDTSPNEQNINQDYLSLRNSKNLRFYIQVKKIMKKFGEEDSKAVFSELVVRHATDRKELIILVTSEMLYLFDRNCNLKCRQRLANLSEIVLVKANPCIVALLFDKGLKLILETVRRTEIVIFILSQRAGKDPKPTVSRGDCIRF